jgi:hypothetical protein
MKIILILLFAVTLSGCRCEKQRPSAETTFMAWLETGAPAPSEAELEAFRYNLTRLNFKQLNQTLEHLNQEHLKELVPERTQPWATRKDPPPSWQDAAYAVVDELSKEDLSATDMARILDHSAERTLKAQIFLTQLGLVHPMKGWQLLNRFYTLAHEREFYDYPATTATTFFAATYSDNPTLAAELLSSPVKDGEYAKSAIRSDAFLGCLFSASTPQEIESLLNLAIAHGFQNHGLTNTGLIENPFFSGIHDQSNLSHGVALLAQMNPKSARDWILQNKEKIGDYWAVGYISGAVGFPRPAPDDFQSQYEAAIEFIARQTSPRSDILKRVMRAYGNPSPKLDTLIKEIRDQQKEAKPSNPR